eukprot:7410557-Pyramimonas_sp.AAC.1
MRSAAFLTASPPGVHCDFGRAGSFCRSGRTVFGTGLHGGARFLALARRNATAVAYKPCASPGPS